MSDRWAVEGAPHARMVTDPPSDLDDRRGDERARPILDGTMAAR